MKGWTSCALEATVMQLQLLVLLLLVFPCIGKLLAATHTELQMASVTYATALATLSLDTSLCGLICLCLTAC